MVQYIWNFIPFTWLTGQFGAILNLLLFPLFWWIYIPFQLFVVDPWNIIWSIILCGPFFFVFIFFLGPLFLIAVVAAYLYIIILCCGCCCVVSTT